MNEKSATQNLNRISTNVDQLISIHGSEHTADLIESIVLNKNSCIDTIDIQKLIITEVCKSFKVNLKLLDTSNSEVKKKRENPVSIYCMCTGSYRMQQSKRNFQSLKKIEQ